MKRFIGIANISSRLNFWVKNVADVVKTFVNPKAAETVDEFRYPKIELRRISGRSWTTGFSVALLMLGWILSPTLGQLPTPPPGKPGHAVSIENRFPPTTNGYQTIRVAVETNPIRPVTRDEVYTVVVMARSYRQETQVVTAPLVIETGRSSGTAEIYFPSGTMNSGLNYSQLFIERGNGNGQFESGRDLFSTHVDLNNANTNASGSDPLTLLISSAIPPSSGVRWVGSGGGFVRADETPVSAKGKLPALDNLAVCFKAPGGTTSSVFSPFGATDRVHAIHPLDLPASWIGLSGVQQIYLSLAELKAISLADDSRRDCIERWVAAGGSLIVFDAGTKFKDANKIVPLVLGPARAAEISASELKLFESQWRESTRKLNSVEQLILMPYAQNRFGYGSVEERQELEQTGITEQNAWRSVDSSRLSDVKNRFVIQSYVDGRVVAVADDMQNWQPIHFVHLLNAISIDGPQLSWRLGMANPHTSLLGFKIPGVGDPPLVAFRVLIGMFLFAAGPLMVFVLRRWRQLQLLFLLVPLLSLSACAGLLGYAVFVDGFDSWGRVQSVTKIDQRLGSAVARARCAYYTGTQPGPYRFDSETVAMHPTPRNAPVCFLQLGQAAQGQVTQSISGGNIRPRTPHQVVTVGSFQTDHRLIYLPVKDQQAARENDTAKQNKTTSANEGDDQSKSSVGSVRNLLGAKVLYVVANTDQGLVEVQGMEIDEIKAAAATDESTAQTQLRELAFAHSPVFEYQGRQYYYGYDDEDSSMGDEFKIIEALRNNQATSYFERPHTYMAIVERNPLIDSQIEPVKYKKQLHVIIGQW